MTCNPANLHDQLARTITALFWSHSGRRNHYTTYKFVNLDERNRTSYMDHHGSTWYVGAGHHCSTYKLGTTAQYELRIQYPDKCLAGAVAACSARRKIGWKISTANITEIRLIASWTSVTTASLGQNKHRRGRQQRQPPSFWQPRPRPTTHNSQPASRKIAATATATTTTTTTTTTTPTTPIAIAAATPTTTSPTSTTTAPTTITTATTTTATTTPSTTSWLTPAL